MFEIFYHKANTCANNLALSQIVFCPLLHCRHSCQFTFSWVCRVNCLCYVCTLILYIGLLYCTVVQKFLSDRSEHRIHPGDTTHHTPHRQSQILSSGSPTKKGLKIHKKKMQKVTKFLIKLDMSKSIHTTNLIQIMTKIQTSWSWAEPRSGQAWTLQDLTGSLLVYIN